ncbi:MAG: hypothetical protein J0I33_06425 [Microbacterium ginsengisoli]|uniref:hypothetical protein n=1 Tax=Microbacterium TaxID=33882 RepID=UPI0006F6BCA2|nr:MULTISPECIES: hypothetical protein [unclassified Microbacterium]KQR94162.1 hypothetical protein ASF93_04035 [Microbacterium sp. Leaf347]KQR97069.1 hypothetical protein ASG00_12300 [Microbacterium sp. Leaf351]MBN9198257.1 hypothetical protein [Microbacterium ginsengisoli]OJU78403.1 MAG: hypothetical protein BGO15_03805 [Microbacterium sp. 71-23]
MTGIARPQALGAFPFPAGLLLIAGGEETDAARTALVRGILPETWPARLEGVRLVHEGRLDEAAAWFADSDDPVDRYNLFVLDPERVSRSEAAAAVGDDWRPLVDHVAYTVGLTSVPPTSEGLDGELAALVGTAEAAAALADGDEPVALAHLRLAADAARDVAPALAGVVLSELAGRGHDLVDAEEAVALLRGTDLPAAAAEAFFHRAGLVHGLAIEGRRSLGDAIAGYTEALRRIDEVGQRSLFARIHLNLGTAYLAAPIVSDADHLRVGIALQSLRTAVRLLDEERDAEEWASARLNLANALVYAPSAKQRDHLMEAVDLYEVVLRTRSPKKDALGRARVLSNQGNALAHLGLLGDARERFDEAEFLFASKGDESSAAIVRDLRGSLIAVGADD